MFGIYNGKSVRLSLWTFTRLNIPDLPKHCFLSQKVSRPQLSGSVDVVSNLNPCLSARHFGLSRRCVPRLSLFCTCFVVCETWSGAGTTQRRLSVALPLPRGSSYFTSSHFLFLFWFGWAQHCRAMSQRYGCIPARMSKGERERVLWGPWRDSHGLWVLSLPCCFLFWPLCVSKQCVCSTLCNINCTSIKRDKTVPGFIFYTSFLTWDC